MLAYKVRDYGYMLEWSVGEVQEMGRRITRRQRTK